MLSGNGKRGEGPTPLGVVLGWWRVWKIAWVGNCDVRFGILHICMIPLFLLSSIMTVILRYGGPMGEFVQVTTI